MCDWGGSMQPMPDRTYQPGSIGAMFPEAARLMEGLLAERNALEVRVRELTAENERLSARDARLHEWYAAANRVERGVLAAERDRLAAAVQRVRELHHEVNPYDDGPMCAECCELWPCPTAAALDGVQDDGSGQ